MMTTSNKVSLDKLERLIDYWREEINAEWQIQQIKALITISHFGDDGISQTELADILDTSTPVISRTVKVLGRSGKLDKNGKPVVLGLDLVYVTPDIFNGRRNLVKLTDKGWKALKKMEKILNG